MATAVQQRTPVRSTAPAPHPTSTPTLTRGRYFRGALCARLLRRCAPRPHKFWTSSPLLPVGKVLDHRDHVVDIRGQFSSLLRPSPIHSTYVAARRRFW